MCYDGRSAAPRDGKYGTTTTRKPCSIDSARVVAGNAEVDRLDRRVVLCQALGNERQEALFQVDPPTEHEESPRPTMRRTPAGFVNDAAVPRWPSASILPARRSR
jgi:hypothetical protein